MSAPVCCVALYGGHMCSNDNQEHDGDHACECGASWSREESNT